MEACSNVDKVVKSVRSAGMRVGLAVKPSTSIEEVFPWLDQIDQVLVMTVGKGTF